MLAVPTAARFTESTVEEAALAWLEQIGWAYVPGPDLAPDGPDPEREDYGQVILTNRLEAALERLNPGAGDVARAEALRRVRHDGGPALEPANRELHDLIVNGVSVETLRDGQPVGERLRLVDLDQPANNDFLAVNQFTVVEQECNRRPDIVLFVNGLPLVVIELKNLADPRATVEKAFKQLQTYKREIAGLFRTNALLVASDGGESLIGTITSPWERFVAWKTVDGEELVQHPNLETLIKGALTPERLLELLRFFITFEDDGATIEKKVARYHQFHAVRKAMAAALRASGAGGDGRGGVLWHTQGSGKSLTMLFFAAKLLAEPALGNPTLLLLTDRNDLDDQLHRTFLQGAALLRKQPVRAEDRAHLRELLAVEAGGVVSATVQKFQPLPGEDAFPVLTERRNVIVLADEAHRSHYGFGSRVSDDGEARHGLAQNLHDALPNATFVAFTGTPLELADRNTQIVFGNYIDIYDVGRAIADKATVPIHYESRRVPLDLPEEQAALLDEDFEELTEDEEESARNRLKTKWSQLEAVVGSEKRLREIARDLVEHERQRQDALSGKVMIVCMSRRICVALYDELIALHPEWHSDDDATGVLKVVMTGSASEDEALMPHIRTDKRRRALAARFKDPNDPFRIAIVRDMWLTGFDVPALHTMYLDKPMKGHGLMQAISRVNRVFRDKPGGLIVDYLGLANNLKAALRAYVLDGGEPAKPLEDDPELSITRLVAAFVEKLEVCRAAFYGFNYDGFLTGSQSETLATVKTAQDFIIGKNYPDTTFVQRFLDNATALKQAFALASATPAAQAAKREVAFFLTVRAALVKTTGRDASRREEDLDHAIRQLVDRAIAPEGVVDVFAAAGLPKPDISILSETFLEELRGMPQRNLAAELLRKLLNDEITAKRTRGVVQARRFSEKLEETLNRYHNRALETTQIIEALIALAREMREANARGESLGLSDEEVAFYDALTANDSAVAVLGDAQLRMIAREVAETVRNNTRIDWQLREQARADLRRHVRRALRRHGYPPDQQEQAVALVVEQAELFARDETHPASVSRG